MPDSIPQAARVPVKTQIAAVTVYPSQARVTRRGQVHVVKQTIMLEIADLPAALQIDSIQAYPGGSAQVCLQQPRIETGAESGTVSASDNDLGGQIHQLEEAFRTSKDRLVGLNLQRTFLESLVEHAAESLAQGLSHQAISLESITNLLQFFEQTYHQVASAIAQQERLKHELDHQLQTLRHQAQQMSSSLAPHYRILLPLTVEQPGVLDLDIIYDVDQAHWSARYNVRLEDTPPALQLDYMAQVQQNTGESWNGVELKLSTAVPEKSPVPPAPGVWRVNLSPGDRLPDSPSGVRSRSPILNETYRMLGAVPGSEIPHTSLPEDDTTLSVLQSTHAIICFLVPDSGVIASNDQPHQVRVAQWQLEGQFAYVALPQRSSAAYLQANLTTPLEQSPLLPGVVHLFRAGGYVGQTALEYIAPGEPFQLSWGLDERVPIQRELVNRDTQVNGQCQDTRSYRLTLCNPFAHAISIKVVEQIPVSLTEDIQITLTKAEPEAFRLDSGVCQWLSRLDAGETQQIFYEYTVQHPCNMPVIGLDA